jgi:uncharacterized membrane protein YgdD (TMEM256/DUF423 family)
MSRLPLILATVASLLGAAGVALAAGGAHEGGGELARTGAFFLLLHAAAGLALAAHVRLDDGQARALVAAGFAMQAGVALFSAELAMRAFTDDRIFAFAAPIGGSIMLLSWLGLALIFAIGVRD